MAIAIAVKTARPVPTDPAAAKQPLFFRRFDGICEQESMRHVNYLHYDADSQKTTLESRCPDQIGLKPLMVLESWANAYGTGIEGSRQAFKHGLAVRQKLPVLIDPFRQIYFFPTQSPKSVACVWINASQIKRVNAYGLGTRIAFHDGTELHLPLGLRSIKRQLLRIETMRNAILNRVMAEGLTPH